MWYDKPDIMQEAVWGGFRGAPVYRIYNADLRFEILTAVEVLIVIFCVLKPCRLVRKWLPTFRSNASPSSLL